MYHLNDEEDKQYCPDCGYDYCVCNVSRDAVTPNGLARAQLALYGVSIVEAPFKDCVID